MARLTKASLEFSLGSRGVSRSRYPAYDVANRDSHGGGEDAKDDVDGVEDAAGNGQLDQFIKHTNERRHSYGQECWSRHRVPRGGAFV